MTAPTGAGAADVDALNAQASALIRRGLQALDAGGTDAAARALECFDRALALRLGLPVAQSPVLQYDLAGAWLNRAAVLVTIGGEASMAAAMLAYESALALLRELPLATDSRFPRRLAIAHQNRGMALLAQGLPSVPSAVQAFAEAIDALDHATAADVADRPYLLATAWVSLANAQAMDGSQASCREAIASAGQALRLARDTERDAQDAAELGLKARQICCWAMTRCLLPHGEWPSVPLDDVHLATDAADEGLSLARHWEALGVTRFRSVADDLFLCGASVYAHYQPQFLGEFVIEHRGTSAIAPGLSGR